MEKSSLIKKIKASVKRLAPLYLFISLISVCACSSVDCPVQNTVYTVYHLYKSDGMRDTLSDTLSVSTTRRNGTDSVLLNRSVKTSSFELPISYNDPEDTLFFEIKDTTANSIAVYDTVYVKKDNQPHFESVDCNISFFHNITGVRWTTNAIDSITINKASVNYDASTEHFHIYFKTNR